MVESALKILVVGDVEGQFKSFFKKIESLHKKAGPFDAVFCTGSFFAREGSDIQEQSNDEWLPYLEGEKKSPLPVYILGPIDHTQVNHYAAALEGGDLCEGVHYLGRQGIFTTLEGLRVAYFSGTHDSSAYQSLPHSLDEQRTCYVEKDVTALVSKSKETGYNGVDLLLTADWPKHVYRYTQEAQINTKDGEDKAVQIISDVAKDLKPRYHFVGMQGIAYERAPYANFVPRTPFPVTRFVGLAKYGNKAKAKAMYAFSITPLLKSTREELFVKPEGTSPCPYEAVAHAAGGNAGPMDGIQGENKSFFYGDQSRKRKADYVCRLCSIAGHDIRDCELAGKRGQPTGPGGLLSQADAMAEAGVGRKKFPKQEPLSPCWFCLSSPQVEKHLVVSIGTDMYIAYAKGHLVCEHVLILPINHIGSTRHLSEEAKTELKQHQAALKKYYKEVLGMNLVMFERSYASRHMQIQCIPISSSIPTEEVKAAFRSHGNLSGFPFDDVSAPDKDTATTPNPPHSRNKGFFLVEFADGSQMVHTHVPGEERFPLQFGREVIGSEKICNLPDRIDWKACKVSLEEETALVQQMRKAFGPYEVED